MYEETTASSDPPTMGGGRYPAWRLLILLIAMNTIAYLDRSILSLAIPQLKGDLGLSNTQISFLLGFGFVIFFVLLGYPFGWLVDRMSRRVLVFIGVTIWSLSASAGGLANGFWQLLASRVGVGAGESVLNPSAYSLIADVVPRRRLALALTVYGGSAGLGAALSVAGGGLLLGYAVLHGNFLLPGVGAVKPWQFVLLLTGVPGLVVAPMIFLVSEPPRRDRLRESTGAPPIGDVWRFLWSRRRLMSAIFAGFSILQILSYSFSLWEPTYLVQRFGWKISAVGLAMTMGMILSFAGSFAAGWIVDALVARGIIDAPLRWSGAVALLCALLLSMAFMLPNAWACIVLVSIAQIPLSLIGILSTALQQVTPNEYRGRTSALFLLFGNVIGFGFGPLLPAYLTDHVFASETMLGQSIALVALVSGVGAALLLWSGCRPMRAGVADSQRWMSTPLTHPVAGISHI
jgi:MFS family permease